MVEQNYLTIETDDVFDICLISFAFAIVFLLGIFCILLSINGDILLIVMGLIICFIVYFLILFLISEKLRMEEPCYYYE